MPDTQQTNEPVRCPACHDLFIPEHHEIPTHYLDTGDSSPECPGSHTGTLT